VVITTTIETVYAIHVWITVSNAKTERAVNGVMMVIIYTTNVVYARVLKDTSLQMANAFNAVTTVNNAITANNVKCVMMTLLLLMVNAVNHRVQQGIT
jgi:hypothetical protein